MRPPLHQLRAESVKELMRESATVDRSARELR